MGKKLSSFIGDSTYTRAPPNYRSPLRSNEGGQIGKHLQNKDSDSWKILKDVSNYSLSKMESLDAKLLDEDIYKTLNNMFPNNSDLEGFQKFGWISKVSIPFDKSKNL